MVEEMADFFIGAPPIHVETLDFDAMYARKPRVRIVIFDACPA
jgi:hypothetical protein